MVVLVVVVTYPRNMDQIRAGAPRPCLSFENSKIQKFKMLDQEIKLKSSEIRQLNNIRNFEIHKFKINKKNFF